MLKRTSFRIAAGAVAAGAVLLLVGLASAVTTYSDFPVAVTCTSAGQECSPAYERTVTTSSRLDLEFTSASTSCSNFSVTFFVDGAAVFTSGVLAPGASTGTFVAGPVVSGLHALAVQATGTTGGCDTGTLTGWSGRLLVTTNNDPATPTPTVAPAPPPAPAPKAGPTSVEQCKKGGWATFVSPSFKNQGDCVSYVEHLRERGDERRGAKGDDDRRDRSDHGDHGRDRKGRG